MEVPINLLIRNYRPRTVISTICLLWGTVVTCMGFAKHWEGLVAGRAILGCLEGGLLPACIYLISAWYERYQLQKRLAFFYSIGLFATGLSSILAYGLARIGPVGHYLSWSFIFFVEGGMTILVGAVAYFFIVDFPDQVHHRFLSESDHARVLDRLAADHLESNHDTLTMRKSVEYLIEWKSWVHALMLMCTTTPAYALNFFLPTILRQRLNFSLVKAQCLTAPPYFATILLTIITATLSDHYQLRSPFIVFHAALSMVGLILLYCDKLSSGVHYFAVFLVAGGSNANGPAILGFMQNNIHTSSRRAVLLGLQIGSFENHFHFLSI